MPRSRHALLLALSLIVLAGAAGCGKQEPLDDGKGPTLGSKGDDEKAVRELGFPAFATKNTTRVGGADATANAAGVALAVFPGGSAKRHPAAVTLVNADDWRGGIAAAALMGTPLRAPILLSGDSELPDSSRAALSALAPRGAKALEGTQLIRVGEVAKPGGLRKRSIDALNPFALAAQIDSFRTAVIGKPSDRVVVVSGERSDYAMPAAAWAAKSGDPVLYVTRDHVPTETVAALRAHQQPKIYVLGPKSVIAERVIARLRRLGTVKRIAGKTPADNAIAFARYSDGDFGWNITDPGHGLVFANETNPLDAAAAAPLSSAGSYGPLLLMRDKGLPRALVDYLLDIQPGYVGDPVRAVYNHGWLIGDEQAISVADQSRIDALLEVVPVSANSSPLPTS